MDHGEGDYCSVNVDKVDMFKYPSLQNLPWWSARLEQGDCMFIPYGWVGSSLKRINKRGTTQNNALFIIFAWAWMSEITATMVESLFWDTSIEGTPLLKRHSVGHLYWRDTSNQGTQYMSPLLMGHLHLGDTVYVISIEGAPPFRGHSIGHFYWRNTSI